MTSGSDIRLRDISLGPARVAALRKGGALHKYDHGHALILSGGAGRSAGCRV